MISLNLISPEQKKRIHLIVIYQKLKNISFILLSATIITALVFYFINILMQSNKDSIASQISSERTAVEQGKTTSTDNAIKTLNEQLALAENIQDKYIKWTSFLSVFTAEIPKGITLSAVQLNASTQSFRLAGIADNRDMLVAFQESLKNFKYFTDLTFPISNLAQKEKVNFEITGKLSSIIYEES